MIDNVCTRATIRIARGANLSSCWPNRARICAWLFAPLATGALADIAITRGELEDERTAVLKVLLHAKVVDIFVKLNLSRLT